jgi:tRNA(fMet)-specific endonuclease VapC
MFVILDTNHLRELVSDESATGLRLRQRIAEHQAEVFTSIIVVEESLRGWMALLNKQQHGLDQVETYTRMQAALETSVRLGVLPFDTDTAMIFTRLRSVFRRSGTMDLKIASIALAHEAMLLTRNLEDFRLIPELQVANWLD